ncbi:hypothetical protein P154DRAFT_502038 [Amniculicola lignicola CBS 123094]|uniref:Polyketide cyclase/dehydrase n=1 Tax=Amniculicola lignicola CBS 123094 TaxID=1392246 RepID=A0A6A5W5F1_9PLEO|nr:hypothetical protein P154DRAFT_502038 [Amniculicola lignicola CBS 123094]
MVHVEVEINASPTEVRAVVLDFPSYPEWQTFAKSITIISPPDKSPNLLEPGDKLRAEFSGVTVEPIIESNTSSEFRWYGRGALNAFSGHHYFEYLESKSMPGGTTFVHGEEYMGWLTFIFERGPMSGSVRGMFMGYAEDLEKRAEGVKGGGVSS